MLKVDAEILWNICKDKAREKYGLLYEEANAEDICLQYSEKLSEIKFMQKTYTKTSINRKDIQNLLRNTESIPDDLQVINEGVYFIPIVYSDSDVKDMLIEDLQKMFNKNIVVSNETIRNALHISFDESDYFVSKLLENNLIKVVVENDIGLSYYAIGNKFKEAVNADPFAKALINYAKGGLVTKSDLNNSTEINLTTPIMQYFEQEKLLCRATAKPNKYLVVSLKNDFSKMFMHEASSEIQDYLEKNNFAVTESTMRILCTKLLNELYGLSDEGISEAVIDDVNYNITSYLGLEKWGKSREIFVDGGKLKALIDQKVSVLKNIPVDVDNAIMSGGNGKEILKNYISDKLSAMNLNKDKFVDEFIKNEIIKVSEEKIVEAKLPSIDMDKGDSDE